MPLCGDAADHPASLQDEIGDLLLEELQVRLCLETAADGALVELAVGLRASGAHRRSLARIEGAELDARAVRRRAPWRRRAHRSP